MRIYQETSKFNKMLNMSDITKGENTENIISCTVKTTATVNENKFF